MNRNRKSPSPCGVLAVRVPFRAFLAAIALLVLAAGCGSGTGTDRSGGAPGGKIVLTVWDWHASDPTKGPGLWLAGIDREFEKRHPNVTIKHVGQSHTEYYAIVKAAAAAQRGPDVLMLHQGSRIMDMRGSLAPLSDFIKPAFKQKIAGWELTSDDAGVPWAVPIAVQGCVWYCNKSLLKQAGLDPAKLPQTWDEFLAACDAVKKIGKTGIAVGEKEGFWGEWFINSAYAQTFAPEDRDRLLKGELSWQDPKVAALFTRMKELSDRGCFQKGAMSTPLFPDAGEVFMRGEAAFFLGLISDVAHWREFGEFLKPENIGVMPCPVFQPGPGAGKFPTGGAFAYSITKWTTHPGVAFEYIAFVANDEHAGSFLTDVGSFPANQNYDKGLVKDPNARTIAEWLAAGKTVPQMTEKFPTSVGEAVRREAQRLLSGQTDVPGALAAIAGAAVAARTSGEPRP